MLAYNLNCWLMLFNREAGTDADTLRHTTLATARLRFLFVAAKVWRHAGRTGVSYSDRYEERGLFQRLMDRLRAIAARSRLRAGVGCGVFVRLAVHRILCAGWEMQSGQRHKRKKLPTRGISVRKKGEPEENSDFTQTTH